MKFDTDTIRKNKIELLDCQCEIVLKCLEFYCYSANFLFDRNKRNELKETNLQITLITDTYHQICNQFANSKSNNKIIHIDKEIKKIS